MSDIINTHKCPICGKLFVKDEYMPFCSKRCADIDLGRWFNGSYAVAAENIDEQEIAKLNKVLGNAEKYDE